MQKIIVCNNSQEVSNLSTMLETGEWKVVEAFSRGLDMIFILEKVDEFLEFN